MQFLYAPPIHPPSWKGRSANFVPRGFWEVRRTVAAWGVGYGFFVRHATRGRASDSTGAAEATESSHQAPTVGPGPGSGPPLWGLKTNRRRNRKLRVEAATVEIALEALPLSHGERSVSAFHGCCAGVRYPQWAKNPSTSWALTASSARPIASISASLPRAPIFLRMCLTFEKASSIGLRSGE